MVESLRAAWVAAAEQAFDFAFDAHTVEPLPVAADAAVRVVLEGLIKAERENRGAGISTAVHLLIQLHDLEQTIGGGEQL